MFLPLACKPSRRKPGRPGSIPAPAGRQPCVPEARFPADFLPPAFRRRASRPRWRSRCLWIQGSVLSRRLPGRNRRSRLTSACPGALHCTRSSWPGDAVPAARGAHPRRACKETCTAASSPGSGRGPSGCSVGEPGGGAARAEPLCARRGDGRPRRAGGRRSGARSAGGPGGALAWGPACIPPPGSAGMWAVPREKRR